jgi:DNA end-binding protein Ku
MVYLPEPDEAGLFLLDRNSAIADADVDTVGLLPLLIELIAKHGDADGEDRNDECGDVTIHDPPLPRALSATAPIDALRKSTGLQIPQRPTTRRAGEKFHPGRELVQLPESCSRLGTSLSGVAFMAPRPNWKGFLKLSLVSCAVAMYSATSTSQRIRFNVINRKTGNRIHNEVVDAETGDPVEPDDRVKGYKTEGDQYILVEDDELDNVALESTHTIDIEQFVPMSEVDRIYLDESFYLVPQDNVAQEAFAVIREAMAKEDLAGLARVVVYRRERLLLLRPRGKGLMATALRYKNEVRGEKGYFDDIDNIKVPADMLKLAVHILETKKGHFDPDKFEDRYENAVVEMLKAKQAGKPAPTLAEPKSSNVINLMDALRRSAKADRRQASPSRSSRKGTGRKRPAPRRKVKKAS